MHHDRGEALLINQNYIKRISMDRITNDMEKSIEDKLTYNYWRNKIDGKPARVTEREISYQQTSVAIEKEKLDYFFKITQDHSLSKFTILTTLYAYLLEKYIMDFDGLILGDHILTNMSVPPLLFQCCIEKEQSLRSYLNFVKEEIQTALKYRGYDKCASNPSAPPISPERYTSIGIAHEKMQHTHDLSICLLIRYTEKGSITLQLLHDDELIEAYMAKALLGHLKKMLLSLENILNKPLTTAFSLDEQEKDLVVNTFNDTQVDYPKHQTVVDMFESQTKNRPEHIAIAYENKSLTYHELNVLANQLSIYLKQKHKIDPGDFVGVMLPRSEWLIGVIYGIMKAGAVYVPLAVDYPEQRVAYIKNEINGKLIFDEEALSQFLSEKEGLNKDNPPRQAGPEDLCYVIYTSGTTGEPKGVMIKHHSLVNRLAWMQKAFPLDVEDRLIQKTTYTFDVSVWEIFWWSLYGASLNVPIPGVEKDPASLVENIHEHQVTVMHFVPSMLTVFLHHLKAFPEKKQLLGSLKQVFVSGEALKMTQRDAFFDLLPHVRLMNLYGPTEATIDVSFYDCAEVSTYNCIPIGKPIDNTSLFILDGSLYPVPVGVTGKLYIGGVGVAQGYLNKPKLTQEKFIDNPFCPGTILYDTGDLARWLPDGNIDYKGRKDQQVKLRGYRIELEEIEYALLRQPEVKEVVVAIKPYRNDKALVAYIVSDKPIDKNMLRSRLHAQIPEYMIPNFFMSIRSIPLTKNGKLDRNALPEVFVSAQKDHYTAPQNDLQKALVAIWENILGIDDIGINDNFFELGGHSLLMTEIINAINKKLSKDVSIKEFLLKPTVKELSFALKATTYNPIPGASDFEEVSI